MKRFIVVFVLFLLNISLVSAQFMREIDSIISLTEQGKANIRISFRFTDKIKQIDMPIKGEISNIQTENGNCLVIAGVQQLLQCRPIQPIFTGETNLSVNFVADDLISTNNITSFVFDFPIMWNTERINLMVQLPFGNALSDDVIVPVSPSNSEIGSDGRRIFIKWIFFSKEPDDIIPVRVYYEPLTIPPSAETNQLMVLIIVFAVLFSSILVLYLSLKKRKAELVLSVLNEGERIVVEIIQNQAEEEVDQRKIVAMSGFSKAKVSRIIKSLEERGVLESKRLGRKNKIILKKKFVKEAEQS